MEKIDISQSVKTLEFGSKYEARIQRIFREFDIKTIRDLCQWPGKDLVRVRDMGSKKTPDLIPLCHPIALTHVNVDFELYPEESKVRCVATCETKGRTGVEMEALTAVQVGLLTIYDMLKAVDRGMCMTDIRLLEKHGGKSGDWVLKK